MAAESGANLLHCICRLLAQHQTHAPQQNRCFARSLVGAVEHHVPRVLELSELFGYVALEEASLMLS
jgi:hypothetical protein